MRLPLVTLVSSLVLFSPLARAQSQSFDRDPLLARLSYNVGPSMLDWNAAPGHPQACFALYRSGYYQMSRPGDQGPETLQGALSGAQLLDLGKMLLALDFASSSGGGIVRQGSERFVAEVRRNGEPAHYVWINPDHQNPFPSSAVSIIEWLEDFDARGASRLAPPRELSGEQSICPPTSEGGVHPLTAGLAR